MVGRGHEKPTAFNVSGTIRDNILLMNLPSSTHCCRTLRTSEASIVKSHNPSHSLSRNAGLGCCKLHHLFGDRSSDSQSPSAESCSTVPRVRASFRMLPTWWTDKTRTGQKGALKQPQVLKRLSSEPFWQAKSTWPGLVDRLRLCRIDGHTVQQ